jgi:hypothetical protein
MDKKRPVQGLLLIIVCFILGYLAGPAQQDPEKIREEVRVVNVEVPVRVMFENKPVSGLSRSDFKLFENGKEMEIQGFFPVRKILKREQFDLTANREEKRKPRYFVLVFRISDYNRELKKSIQYFINNLIDPQDKLLLFINDKTMYFGEVLNKADVYSLMDNELRNQGNRAKIRFNQYALKVRQAIDMVRIKNLLNSRDTDAMFMAEDVIQFLENYLAIWRDYKRKYLVPEVDTFYNFARMLEKISLEKWVISFYQFEKFPELKLTGEIRSAIRKLISDLIQGRSEDAAKSRIMSRLLAQIDLELKVSDDFPSEEISKLFYKANATFHSFFFTAYRDELSQDLANREINSDLENCLRLITRKTGGELLVSNKLDVSLKKAIEMEDIYYVLTYVPDNPEKAGKIKVRVNNKKFDVLFDDNIRADYIADYIKRRESEAPEVRLEDVKFENRILYFTIRDIVLREIQGKKSGLLNVQVRIKDEENRAIFEQSKNLTPDNTEIHIRISADWLKRGKYNLIIDVEDLYSQKSDFKYINFSQ